MNCQNCNVKLPFWRMPNSVGQLLLGGWQCHNCHSKLDLAGRVLTKDYPTASAALLLAGLLAGLGLSNYLVLFAGRTGLGMLTLVLSVGSALCGTYALQRRLRQPKR